MEKAAKNKIFTTRYIALLGLFVAIILVMELLGLNQIPLGPGLNMTLSMIPIAVGAMLLGPLAGAILGGVFGVTSFLSAVFGKSAFSAMLFSISPFLTFLVAVPTRILVGLCVGYLFRLYRRLDRHNIWCYFAGGITAPLLNTLFFMTVLVLGFYRTEYIQGFVQKLGAANPFMFVILFVGVQGLIEAAAGLVIGGAVAKGAAYALNYEKKNTKTAKKALMEKVKAAQAQAAKEAAEKAEAEAPEAADGADDGGAE